MVYSVHFQFMPKLSCLMTRHRFEAIGSFLHVVTPAEERTFGNNPLKKILPLQNLMKRRCLDLYQPLQQLSIDERMVKSKARTHLRQYIRNKPTKWGFKYWVLADPTGYTIDFDVYGGARQAHERSDKGLAFDVVMKLIQPFQFQGYLLYCDNFYTSPQLFQELQQIGILATGTLIKNRRGIPASVKNLRDALSRSDVPRGTGYYIKDSQSNLTYVCWKDNKCVTVVSTAHPGSADGTAQRRIKDTTGVSIVADVPQPSPIKEYNKYMGGVDKSDQYIQYHRVLRQTKKYWKTMFFHTIEIAVTNAFLLFQWRRMQSGLPRITENTFRDNLVVELYSRLQNEDSDDSHSDDEDGDTSNLCDITSTSVAIAHGSRFFSGRKRCALCSAKTKRKCPDCPRKPPLCQTPTRDCYTVWHSRHCLSLWKKWQHRNSNTRRGRPKGIVNRRRRRGNYRSRI